MKGYQVLGMYVQIRPGGEVGSAWVVKLLGLVGLVNVGCTQQC